jgi:hypothetical protein
MDLDTLSKMKYKNVQQQNLLTFLKMKKAADDFRKQPNSYPWLLDILTQKDIDVNSGIIVSVSSIPEQYGNQWFATWLTYEKRFFKIEIMADYKTHQLLEIDGFIEDFPEISAHCKGTGKSPTYLALELLESYK